MDYHFEFDWEGGNDMMVPSTLIGNWLWGGILTAAWPTTHQVEQLLKSCLVFHTLAPRRSVDPT